MELKRVSDFGDALGDARRVGIFLSSLRIVSGDCSNSVRPLHEADASHSSPIQKPTMVVCQGNIGAVDGFVPQPYERIEETRLSVDGWQAISGQNAIVPDASWRGDGVP